MNVHALGLQATRAGDAPLDAAEERWRGPPHTGRYLVAVAISTLLFTACSTPSGSDPGAPQLAARCAAEQPDSMRAPGPGLTPVAKPVPLPCRIVVEPTGVVVANDTIDPYRDLLRLPSGRLVSGSYEPETLLLWSPAGELLQVRRLTSGSGPDEVTGWFVAVDVGPADTIHAATADGRWSVFDGDLNLLSQYMRPAGSLLSGLGSFVPVGDGSFLIGGPVRNHRDGGELFRVAGGGGLLNSILTEDPRRVLANGRRPIALGLRGSVWTVAPGDDDLILLSLAGRVEAELSRETDWSREQADAVARGDVSPFSQDEVYRLDVDDAGRIWVYTRVLSEPSEDVFPPAFSGSVVVEVIDPHFGAVLARTSFGIGEEFPRGPVSPGENYWSIVDDEGSARFELFRMRLEAAGGGPLP